MSDVNFYKYLFFLLVINHIRVSPGLPVIYIVAVIITIIIILLACHGKFEIRIEEGWLTEPVVFLIGDYIHYKTMSFLFNFVLYFPQNYHMVKKEKEEYL